ncbi:hypothetical protein [Paenibacillus polymyxa]|uniref:hypothetical protein n=1 Tax=Paenibacillus polymyxa TaxID=1406 RepID=UPI00234A40FC|nr:hypothetical protein [Paenibacillus polymyxa]WCM63636.1 hypothetical protein OYT09_12180 [Paenibacillus polymyxa]
MSNSKKGSSCPARQNNIDLSLTVFLYGEPLLYLSRFLLIMPVLFLNQEKKREYTVVMQMKAQT